MRRATLVAGCALLLVGAGTILLYPETRPWHDRYPMPTATKGPMATVSLVDHGVDLLTAEENGQPCHELRIGGLARGGRTELSSYSCMQPRDQLSVGFLIVDGTQLAAGGAVTPSVATVIVNGQPTRRDGRFFLAVLPTVPDEVNVVALDKDGRVVASEQQSKTLVTSQQTSPPPRP